MRKAIAYSSNRSEIRGGKRDNGELTPLYNAE